MAEIAAIQQKLPSEVLDGVTWPEYLGLLAFWVKWPPLIITSAVLAGMAPEPEKTTSHGGTEMSEEDISMLFALTGQSPADLQGNQPP
ncbi:MAG: hypothetical protein ACREPQ_09610 [Rhodanobacter sp.]